MRAGGDRSDFGDGIDGDADDFEWTVGGGLSGAGGVADSEKLGGGVGGGKGDRVSGFRSIVYLTVDHCSIIVFWECTQMIRLP
jgi:hypothetical protein